MLKLLTQTQFGKESGFERTEYCTHCKKRDWLQTYCTYRYYSLLSLIPVFPCGQHRVQSHCLNCGNYQEVNLAPLLKGVRDAERSLSIDRYSGIKADDVSLTVDLRSDLMILAKFDPFGRFRTWAHKLRSEFGENPVILAALAAAYAQMLQYDEAMELFSQSIELEPDISTLIEFTQVKIKLRQFSEARKLLKFVIESKDITHVRSFFPLLQGYWDAGLIEEGKELLDELETITPSMSRLPDIVHFREEFDTAINGCPAVPDHERLAIAPLRDQYQSKVPRVFQLSGVFLIIALVLASMIYSGSHRTVQLINGTATRYNVIVNGEKYELLPLERKPITLSEGKLTYRIDTPLYKSSPKQVSFGTAFSARLDYQPTFILNPDASAILVTSKATYTSIHDSKPGALRGAAKKLETGKAFYQFNKIDYPFRSFPKIIQLPDFTTEVTRTRLYQLKLDRADAIECLSEHTPSSEVEAALTTLMFIDPQNKECIERLFWSYYTKRAEEFLSLIQPAIDSNTVYPEFHRIYQFIKRRTSPGFDLKGRYERRLEKNRNEPLLHYLLGRLETDEMAAIKHFELAESLGERPIGYGYHAQSLLRLSRGDFSSARRFAKKAVQAKPENVEFRDNQLFCELATGNFNPVLDDIERRIKAQSGKLSLYLRAMIYCGYASDRTRAERYKKAFLKFYLPVRSREYGEQFHQANAHIAYGSQDWKGYLLALKKLEKMGSSLAKHPIFRFNLATLTKDTNQLISLFDEERISGFEAWLACYCVLKNLDTSDRDCNEFMHLGADLANYSGDASLREAAQILRGPAAEVRVDRFMKLKLSSSDRRIFAAALGYKVPQLREEFLAIAREHNIEPRFPWVALHQVLNRTQHKKHR